MEILDLEILNLLNQNGRMSLSQIARELGCTPAGAQQHVAKLVNRGTIKGFQAVIEPSTLGYEACALVGADMSDHNDLENTIQRLLKIPTITECHLTTGHHDLMLIMYGHNNDEIFEQLFNLQKIGLKNTETIISFRCAFSRTLPVNNQDGKKD